MLTGQERWNDFLLLGQAVPLSYPSPPFLSLPVSLPFLSRPLEIAPIPPLPYLPLPSLHM